MSSHFDKAILSILRHEGGYQCDPDDSGNWTSGICGNGTLKGTNFGIACSSYPKLDIKNLTLESAKNLYRADYYNPHYDDLPYQVAAKLFDIGVNCGTGTAAKILQRACGADDDGVVGSKTMALALAMEPDELLEEICQRQKLYYRAVVERDPRKAKYLSGWNKRSEWKPIATT